MALTQILVHRGEPRTSISGLTRILVSSVAQAREESQLPSNNRGQKSWDTFAFLGRFPIYTGPTPPLTPQTILDACIQIFSEFQLCIGWGGGGGGTENCKKIRKGCTVLRGNRGMTEKKNEYCSAILGTFVLDCSITMQ